MPKRKNLIARILLLSVLALVMGLVGCASLVSSSKELQSIGDNEGVVMGSFLLNVEQGNKNESGWAFLKGRKTANSDYSLSIRAKKYYVLGNFDTSYSIDVKPEEEFTFIKKLPAGVYEVVSIKQLGFSNLSLRPGEAIIFEVKPGKTIYIGRLTAYFPYRMNGFRSVRLGVTDAKDEAITSLKDEYQDFDFSNVVTELMR